MRTVGHLGRAGHQLAGRSVRTASAFFPEASCFLRLFRKRLPQSGLPLPVCHQNDDRPEAPRALLSPDV
jgi:hypothetical protein